MGRTVPSMRQIFDQMLSEINDNRDLLGNHMSEKLEKYISYLRKNVQIIQFFHTRPELIMMLMCLAFDEDGEISGTDNKCTRD
ncbi:hypothetical protein [Caldiplasma sukawensis]